MEEKHTTQKEQQDDNKIPNIEETLEKLNKQETENDNKDNLNQFKMVKLTKIEIDQGDVCSMGDNDANKMQLENQPPATIEIRHQPIYLINTGKAEPEPSYFNNNEEKFQNPNLINNIPIPKISNAMLKEIKKVSENDVESINRKFCILIFLLHFITLGIAIAVSLFLFSFDSKFGFLENAYFQEIKNNWKSNLISAIKANECNNQGENLIKQYWPGTKEGCSCYNNVSSGGCSPKSSCKTIFAYSPIPFTYWRTVRFCADRDSYIENKTYFDLVIEEKASDCPAGSRSCGVIDSIGNHLCIPSNLACPVNYMQFYDQEPYDKIKSTISADNRIIEIPTKGALVYSNSEKGKNLNEIQIPIDFKISNDQPCLNPYYQNINTVYILENYSGRNACLKFKDSILSLPERYDPNFSGAFNKSLSFDSNYKEIDTVYMEYLYNANGISQIMSRFPLFSPNIYKRNIKLYMRNYIGLKIRCLKNIKANGSSIDLLESLTPLNKFTFEGFDFLVVLSIFIFSINIIMFFFIGYVNIAHSYYYQLRLSKTFFVIYFVQAFITMVFLLVNIFSLVALMSNLSLKPVFYSIFGDANCVDSLSFEFFQKLIFWMDSIKALAYLSIGLYALEFICFLVISIIGVYFFYDDKLLTH